MRKVHLFLLLALTALAPVTVTAQDADALRGGWIADIDGTRHIYYIVLRNDTMSGTDFHFEIVHEDNGGGFEQYGPFSNVSEVQISEHEMHMTSYASYAGPEGRKIEMTLLGPVNAGVFSRAAEYDPEH